MNKRTTTLSVAAILAGSVLVLQAPIAGAQDNNTQAGQQGVPGVEMNVGESASDRGVPGVEMNVGRDGDQDNLDTNTMGAGADTSGTATLDSDSSLDRPMQADRG